MHLNDCITTCVVSFRYNESNTNYKGILIESSNHHTNITNQIIINGSCNPINKVYDFVRIENEECLKPVLIVIKLLIWKNLE